MMDNCAETLNSDSDKIAQVNKILKLLLDAKLVCHLICYKFGNSIHVYKH